LSASAPAAPPAEHDKGTVPLPQPLKQKIKDGLVALSLANLCFMRVGFDLMSDKDRFFNKLPATTPMLLALAANLFGFALLAWLVMQVLRRFSSRWLHLAVHLVFLFTLLLPVDFLRVNLTEVTDYQVLMFLKQPVVMVCGFALLALIVWRHRLVAKIAATVVAIFSPLAIFVIAKIVVACLGVSQLQNCSNVSLPPAGPVHQGQPRVVWIIFDEMDYRVVFDQRPAGLQLPMPALILGQRISAVSTENTCDLSITFADSGATTTWSGQPSVFSEARKLGVNTALVGWYIPYDRMLGNSLNFCAWYAFPRYEPARAETFKANLWRQIRSLSGAFNTRWLFIDMLRDGLQTSLPLATNPTYGLVLLHLPAPHRPGVYRPKSGKFSVLSTSKVIGYFNNLVFADRELGALRRAMETAGEWDKTWLIISADHSWRESLLYDKKRDMRIPFLVKTPGANGPMTYSQPFNTILTHNLILAILRGEVTNQQDTVRWLEAHGRQIAPVTGGSAE
jgi:hypothetical protein